MSYLVKREFMNSFFCVHWNNFHNHQALILRYVVSSLHCILWLWSVMHNCYNILHTNLDFVCHFPEIYSVINSNKLIILKPLLEVRLFWSLLFIGSRSFTTFTPNVSRALSYETKLFWCTPKCMRKTVMYVRRNT